MTGSVDVATLSAHPTIVKLGQLSPRLQEVGAMIARGLMHKEISRELGISTQTVKNHITRIYDKLDIRSPGELGYIMALWEVSKAAPVLRVGNQHLNDDLRELGGET